MMENAARAQRWLLRSAPVSALAGAFWGAGGAAAGLALWLGLGLLLNGGRARIRLYPKQRRMAIHRLFLGYAFCVFNLSGMDAAGNWLFMGSLSPAVHTLLLLGGVGFSLPLGAWALRWRIRRRAAVLLGWLLFVLSLMILYFSNPIQPN